MFFGARWVDTCKFFSTVVHNKCSGIIGGCDDVDGDFEDDSCVEKSNT